MACAWPLKALALCIAASLSLVHGGTVKLSISTATAAVPTSFVVTLADDKGIISSSKFVLGHTKLLHLVAVGSDLDAFLHVHPEDLSKSPITQGGQAFSFTKLTFPKAGKYTLGFDGKLAAREVSAKTTLTVSGSPAMASKPYASRVGLKQLSTKALKYTSSIPGISLTSLLLPASSSPLFSGSTYQASLSGPTGAQCTPGKASTFVFTISKGGAPVKDLTPLLGADMHVAAVSDDGAYFAHGHGMAGSMAGDMAGDMGHMDHGPSSGRFGPDVSVALTLPKKGLYVLVGQLRRGTDLIIAPFWITCTGSSSSGGKPGPMPMPMPKPGPKPAPSPMDMDMDVDMHAGHHMG